MLIASNQIQISERTIRSKEGFLFRVRVAVMDVGGVPHIKVLNVSRVGQLQGKQVNKALSLPHFTKIAEDFVIENASHVESPFFSAFDFFMSQPTRAPSL